MASSSTFWFGNRVLQRKNKSDNAGKGSVLRSVDECRNDTMSSANVQLLEDFICFCQSKKINLDNGAGQGGVPSCDSEANGSADFRDDIKTYFGDQLPASVVDKLCKLVNDNTHGKCRSCKMPAENLVLGVLHILSDAAQTIEDCKENVPPMGASTVIVNPHLGGQNPMKCTRVKNVSAKFSSCGPILHHNASLIPNDKSVHPTGGCQNMVSQNIQLNCSQQQIRSGEGNATTMSKKSRVESVANQGNGVSDSFLFAEQPSAHAVAQGAGAVNAVSNLCQESMHGIRTDSGQRFSVTKEDLRHYNAICSLAQSQWSGQKAVVYSEWTKVTYSSLGGSVEPGGKVDKFFIAGICRYFFETVHPRQSKKHFFYPIVGGALYNYNNPQATETVQREAMNTLERSFTGADSAHRLNRSHKLCFPIAIDMHWFVFLVDMKNHLFVFMDSFPDSSSNFLMDVSSKLINAFIECRHQFAEGYTCFDDFRPFFPEVPKHNNVADCGIFAVKFMELWDMEVDLRNVFDQNDIPNIRVKLAIEMFLSRANSIDKSRVLNFSCSRGRFNVRSAS